MRILHVTESLGLGGKERQIAELLKGLFVHRDIESFVAVMSHDDFQYEIDREQVEIIPVLGLLLAFWIIAWTAWALS